MREPSSRKRFGGASRVGFAGALGVRATAFPLPSSGEGQGVSVKIAQTLARAGLHLGTTTVGRMLKGGEDAAERTPAPTAAPAPDAGTTPVGPYCREGLSGKEAAADAESSVTKPRVLTAKRPNHVWHVDLTTVPTAAGFWTSWLPFALLQCWPFSWWVAVVIDHFSRRVMGVAVFAKQPTSLAIRAFLRRTIAKAGSPPKYLVCDRGCQFDCAGFRDWCQRSGIKPPRYGAIGRHGSIAVVERFILSLKDGCSRVLLVPYRRENFLRELRYFGEWYNGFRAHTTLGGRTPDEVYHAERPANRSPRFKPRVGWPRGSPCARPWALVRGKPGARLELEVTFHRGRKHLPIVALKHTA